MIFLIFLFGIIIGSFLNVCIYRIPREESISYPSSHCTSCAYRIRWYDNIPIISYLLLGGKCRNCGEKISAIYPSVELLNGMVYIALYSKFGFSIDFIFLALLSSTLIVLVFIDAIHMLIPDILIIIIFIISILHKLALYFLIGVNPNFLDSIVGMLVAGALFLLIVILSKGGMGHGDITLISALGFVQGLKPILLTIFLSFLVGSLISIFLLVSNIKKRTEPIPFGPFIVVAFYLSLNFAQDIWAWYLGFL